MAEYKRHTPELAEPVQHAFYSVHQSNPALPSSFPLANKVIRISGSFLQPRIFPSVGWLVKGGSLYHQAYLHHGPFYERFCKGQGDEHLFLSSLILKRNDFNVKCVTISWFQSRTERWVSPPHPFSITTPRGMGSPLARLPLTVRCDLRPD